MTNTTNTAAASGAATIQRFNNRAGLMNPEGNGLYVRYEDHLAALAAPAQAVPAPGAPSDPSITLDFKMATELLEMFGGEPGLVTLQQGGDRSHSGAGLYAFWSDMPEEGAEFLGAEPDDEAIPPTAVAEPAAPAQAGEYPELPDCKYAQSGDIKDFGWYSADQMRAYADATCAARGAAQAAPEKDCHHLQDLANALRSVDELSRQVRLLEQQAGSEVWRWESSRHDDLQSMGNEMGVLIYACDLRALLGAQAAPVDADVQQDRGEFNRGFNAATCVALQVLRGFGDTDSTAWREILKSAGRAEIENYAKNIAPENWVLCGFAHIAAQAKSERKADAARAAQGGAA